MYKNSNYFFVLSQSNSISEAASKLFVSQQYLSQYIQSLEEYYHASLFVRKPKLRLTSAGRMVSAHLKQIQLLETDLLAKIDNRYNPVIHLGITYARASLLSAKLIQRYQQECPQTTIIMHHDNSSRLEEQLITGDLDIYIGTTSVQKTELQYIPLIDEKIYMVISESMKKEYFNASWNHLEQTFSTQHLAQLDHLPFCTSPDDVTKSTLNSIRQITGCEINEVFSCYDPSVRLSLCQENFCATFIPESFIHMVNQANQASYSDNKHLHCYAVHDYGMPYHLNATFLKKNYLPDYLRIFVNTALNITSDLMKTISQSSTIR